MLLLNVKLSKVYNKLDNHNHHEPEEAFLASLQVFKSDVSCFLNQHISKDSSLSFSVFGQCFEVLALSNKAFGKLVVDIDHPFTRWEAASMEEYLSYTLSLLDLLNSISSSLSHLSQARLSLSHALSLVASSPAAAADHFKAIDHLNPNASKWGPEEKGVEDKRVCSGKELVLHEALMEMRRIGLWVCGIVLSGLSGDDRPYMEIMREKAVGFGDSKSGGGMRLKEVEEMKEAVDCLVAAMAGGESTSNETEELDRKVERFEKMVDGLGKEVDHLFSQALASRNQLLHGIRPMKQ